MHEMTETERALHSLWFEIQHHRNTGRGLCFLLAAIDKAEKELIRTGALPLAATIAQVPA